MTGAALTKVFIMSGLMIFIFGFIVGSVSMMFSLGLFRYNLSVEEYLNDSSSWIDVSKSLPYEYEDVISPENNKLTIDVLVAFESGQYIVNSMAYGNISDNCDEEYWFWTIEFGGKPICWKPIPKLPK